MSEGETNGEQLAGARSRDGRRYALELNSAPLWDLTTCPWSVQLPGSIEGLVATPIAEFWLPPVETE